MPLLQSKAAWALGRPNNNNLTRLIDRIIFINPRKSIDRRCRHSPRPQQVDTGCRDSPRPRGRQIVRITTIFDKFPNNKTRFTKVRLRCPRRTVSRPTTWRVSRPCASFSSRSCRRCVRSTPSFLRSMDNVEKVESSNSCLIMLRRIRKLSRPVPRQQSMYSMGKNHAREIMARQN